MLLQFFELKLNKRDCQPFWFYLSLRIESLQNTKVMHVYRYRYKRALKECKTKENSVS